MLKILNPRLIYKSHRLLRPQRWTTIAIRNLASSEKDKNEQLFKEDFFHNGIHFDEIDEIMSDQVLKPINNYPKLSIAPRSHERPLEGHNLLVLQPWVSYANFDEFTDPDIQLDECVSLGNTIKNWKVVEKRLVFCRNMNMKHVLNPKAFEELKELVSSRPDITAVLIGLDMLSGVQLSSLEKELRIPVYDRFTIVLNIFRQHARTKEAKLQLALAELPYIRGHLREIHESSEFSSSAESLKMLVGGVGAKFYKRRLDILKTRESRLKYLLAEVRRQRDRNRLKRKKEKFPTISVVGYTNAGKTSLIKYLTNDENLVPKDQLFATLDVTTHAGQLPCAKTVLYMDTVGFLSRIPSLLVEAFSVTLRECQESDLILHVLDLSHPDYKLQYKTVIDALNVLRIPKSLIETKITIGNKCDKLPKDQIVPEDIPKCDVHISLTENINLNKMADILNDRVSSNTGHKILTLRIANGGLKYKWLSKHSTILECKADESDGNYLICRVSLNPTTFGKWNHICARREILPSSTL